MIGPAGSHPTADGRGVIGFELTPQLAAMRLFAGLAIAMVQGLTIVAVAVALGDKGPRHDGRLAPFSHFDVGGLAALVLTGFGWSRPVAIDGAEMRIGRWGLVIAPLAGSAALLLLGWLLLLLVMPALTLLPHTAAIVTAAFLRTAAQLCVWMALFALLPLPPLAGAHFLEAAWRPGAGNDGRHHRLAAVRPVAAGGDAAGAGAALCGGRAAGAWGGTGQVEPSPIGDCGTFVGPRVKPGDDGGCGTSVHNKLRHPRA